MLVLVSSGVCLRYFAIKVLGNVAELFFDFLHDIVRSAVSSVDFSVVNQKLLAVVSKDPSGDIHLDNRTGLCDSFANLLCISHAFP